MDNIERCKVLLGKLKQGSEFEVEAISQILPQFLTDFFTIDQVMSLLLGELVRTNQRGRPQILFQMLSKVFAIYHSHWDGNISSVILDWILMCLKNFLQLEPYLYSLWSISSLLLSISTTPLLQVCFSSLYFFFLHSSY